MCSCGSLNVCRRFVPHLADLDMPGVGTWNIFIENILYSINYLVFTLLCLYYIILKMTKQILVCEL